jgi:Abnormal spindle-like microcephaly-assoc'd, ASPM-SPD-2-Hydin
MPFCSIQRFGKNLVISSGQNCGSLWFLQLSPTDGTISASNSFFPPCGDLATPIAFDPTSTFFYVQYTGSEVVETGTRIFNGSTATEAASSPLPASLESEIGGMADPQGPFSFFCGPSPSNGILVFGVDPSTGYPLTPTAFNNPLFPGRNLILGVATVDVNGEPEQVPAESLSVTSLSFGAVTLGQTSSAQSVTLTDSGGLPLSLTSIQVTGTNAADFTEVDTCMGSPQLQPNKSCTITVSFHPSLAAGESATVVITDNAAGSPQQITLTGTGTNPGPPPPPTPAVTLNPDPLSFPGTTEGTVSQAQSIVVTKLLLRIGRWRRHRRNRDCINARRRRRRRRL